MNTKEIKDDIDSKDVRELLSAVRFSPIGSPIFQGETGDYWLKRLAELRSKDPQAFTNASKDIGW